MAPLTKNLKKGSNFEFHPGKFYLLKLAVSEDILQNSHKEKQLQKLQECCRLSVSDFTTSGLKKNLTNQCLTTSIVVLTTIEGTL